MRRTAGREFSKAIGAERRIDRLLESHPAVKAAAVVPVAWRGRDRLVACIPASLLPDELRKIFPEESSRGPSARSWPTTSSTTPPPT